MQQYIERAFVRALKYLLEEWCSLSSGLSETCGDLARYADSSLKL